MDGSPSGLLILLVTVTAASVSAVGPDAKYKAPRNEYGQPDLRAVWNFSSDVPLERPPALGDRRFFTKEEVEKQRVGRQKAFGVVGKLAPVEEVGLAWLDYNAQVENLRTSLIQYPLNGRLPKLVEGAVRVPGAAEFLALLNEANGPVPPLSPELLAGFGAGRKDGAEDLPLSERCLPGAYVPIVPGFDNNYLQILEGKDHVVLLAESRDPRIVPLDGRPHGADKLRRWAGDPRGHWDGDTLVVETTNFNGRTRSFVGAGTSFDKVVTERFTRTSRDALEYEATVVDPKTFEDKVVLSFPMGRVETRIYEDACHEGNYSLAITLAGARREERDATK